jgi:type IV pilus assembly protein PilQ
MSSVVRLIALALCAALGVGVAICLATSKVNPGKPKAPIASIERLPATPSAATPPAAPPRVAKLQLPISADSDESARPAKQPPKPSPRIAKTRGSTKAVVIAPRPAFAQSLEDQLRDKLQEQDNEEQQQQVPQEPTSPADLVDRLENTINRISKEQVKNKDSLNAAVKAITGKDAAALIGAPDPGAAARPQLPAPSDVNPLLPAPVAKPAATPNFTAAPSRAPKADIKRIEGEGDDKLSIHIQDSDIREVLDLLSEQGNLNILASNSVQGKVSASLNGVDIDTALDAILKSTGFVARREGRFIYVGTPKDFQLMEEAVDKLGTRMYRPNYIKASDLQALIQPLLTPSVGIVSVTTPSNIGIAPDGNTAGGDLFAGGEAVLVKDYEAVLAQVDQVFEELDKKPMQVAIEAMILSVRLNDKNTFGVDFLLLRDQAHVRLASGKPLTDLAQMSFDGGLKFGFLDSSLGVFINALESIGDTNVIASPRLMCINKHRAEILIGSQLGYVNTTLTETSTAQNVQFLEVGAQLRLRPFISSDGLIRMEVHPELSTGSVRVEEGFTLPDKELTQVTTNIMVRDGCTVIIGGLMREDLTTNTTQIPLLGSTPGIGWLFRQKTETTEKREIIVLITPHIVYEPTAYAEGEKGACEFHRHQAVYADHMSPIGTRYLGRKYFRIAQDRWACNDRDAAMRAVNLAIHFDPQCRAAIDLRGDIMAQNHLGDHSGGNGEFSVPPPGSPPPGSIYEGEDQIDPPGSSAAIYPNGSAGRVRPIVKPSTMR